LEIQEKGSNGHLDDSLILLGEEAVEAFHKEVALLASWFANQRASLPQYLATFPPKDTLVQRGFKENED
jgi:hypothetical protein